MTQPKRTILITGATNGIGLATARKLAAEDDNLIIVSRGRERGEDALRRLKTLGDGQVDLLVADLACLADVTRLAAQAAEIHPQIDVVLNNAGAVYRRRQLTVDGFEMTFAVNHLAPFLLTNSLLPALTASAPARVVTVASDAAKGASIDFDDINAERHYRPFKAYGQSKLANILFTYELARRLEGSGITSNCCHPGLIASGFNKNNGALMRAAMTIVRPFQKSADRGAETPVYLSSSHEVAGVTGKYFVDCKEQRSPDASYDEVVARRLWSLSAEMTGLQSPQVPAGRP